MEKKGASKLKDSERKEIGILREKKYSLRLIAKSLKRSVSTISDEIKRNAVRGIYDAVKAIHKAYTRRRVAKYQGMKIVGHDALRKRVEELLKEGRSPESIAGRISKREKTLPAISGDSIERFLRSVYGRKIEVIRKKLLAVRKWHHRRKKVTELTNRKWIDIRPQIVNSRGRVGDAEADFIVSGRDGHGILLTVADRKLRVSFIEQILVVTIKNVERACLKVKERYPEWRTMTTDNDVLWEHHERLERLLGITIYFCHPYHSWEKGTIENTNGEIRKYIPKSSDISKYSKYFIQKVEDKINNRFMDCLKFLTPHEALERHRKRRKLFKNKKSPKRGCSD